MTLFSFIENHIIFSFLVFCGIFSLLVLMLLALVDISGHLTRIGKKTVVNHHHHTHGCAGEHTEGPCPKS